MKTPQAYINSRPFTITSSTETVLDFLQHHFGDTVIPTLCKAPNLEPIGSCRLCTVKVKNPTDKDFRMVAACHTPVTPECEIITHSGDLKALRRNIMELILTDHPLDCVICEANGQCELQDTAAEIGIKAVRYAPGKDHHHYPQDLSHPFMRSDLAKCINCYRCIEACDQIQGDFILNMAGRGMDSRVIKSLDSSFENSTCVACGACAQTCPTAAISDVFKFKEAAALDQVATVCTYCGVGCNLRVSAGVDGVLSIDAPWGSEVNPGHTCLKGRYAFGFYNHRDRLRDPMIKRNGTLEPVGWEEVYQFITAKLSAIKETYGPHAVAGISSSRCTNEENYLMQKFMRAVIGTNNIDGCARLCHAPTAIGMQRTFGTGAATNSIKDLELTDCILVIGANPTEAHPVTGAKIKQQAFKGKTLVVIDPRATEMARLADYHLQLRPGTNVAVLNMMMYFIIKNNWADQEFIKERCEGYQLFEEQVLGVDVDFLSAISGVPKELAFNAAKVYAQSGASMCFHGLGVTEHAQGTDAVCLIADLAMITGNIGRPGVGVNPLRGQNNVQGSADMGVQPNQGPGYLKMDDPGVRNYYQEHYGVPIPDDRGLTIPEMLDEALAGRLKALWIMGEHVLQTEPNIEKVKKALQNLDLLIVQELFPTETALQAHVVLPGASFLEKSGTFTNGERRVQRVNKVVAPIGNSKSDGQIITDVMQEMGYDQEDYDHKKVLAEIAQVVPFFWGITWENLGANGKQWPVNSDGSDTEILHTETFKIGKGRLIFKPFRESPELQEHAKKYPFILTTNRALEHYNCGTMTQRTELNELMEEDILLINPSDAAKRNMVDGELVTITSARASTQIRIKVDRSVNPGVLSTTFHFPEILINKLSGDVYDPDSYCPEYKVIAVDIYKIS